MVVERQLAVEADTGEVGVHDEVHDAGDGVRTVDRRGAAGEHVDALDDRRRDEVEIGDRGGGIAGDEATAVDQHERADRAEVAKVDRGDAGRAVGVGRTLAGEDLRQRVEEIFDAGRALKLDFLRRHDRDRAGRGQVRLRNARTGDDDVAGVDDRGAFGVGRALGDGIGRLRRRSNRVRRTGGGLNDLSESGRGADHRADDDRRREQALADIEFHKVFP